MRGHVRLHFLHTPRVGIGLEKRRAGRRDSSVTQNSAVCGEEIKGFRARIVRGRQKIAQND